ncbi:MAG: hypothetical protein LBI38_03480 [Oscillospiraceae bacterium]|jgi:hypothetical protein|nr:hypothetical protein [Oscillospiraceae bacterium]
MKDNIKKMYDNITPKGSNARFADAVAEKAEGQNRKNGLISSPVLALCFSAVLITGSALFVMNAPWLRQPVDEDPVGFGIEIDHDAAWTAFDGLVENARALRGIAVIPEYEVLEKNPEDWEIEIAGIASDGYGGVYVALNIAAKEIYEGAPYALTADITGRGSEKTFAFDEEGKARVAISLYCDVPGDGEFTLSLSGAAEAAFRVKADFPSCPSKKFEFAGSTFIVTPLGVMGDDPYGEENSARKLTDSVIAATFGDQTSLRTQPYSSSAAGIIFDLKTGCYAVLYDIAAGRNVIIDVNGLLNVQVVESPYDDEEADEFDVPENELEAALEAKLFEEIKRLNPIIGVLEWQTAKYPEDIKIGWNNLYTYCNEDDMLSGEEAYASGLIDGNAEYYDSHERFYKISSLKKYYDYLFSGKARNISFDLSESLGNVIDGEYFQAAAFDAAQSAAMFLLAAEKSESGDAVKLTVATGWFSFTEDGNDYYVDINGVIVGYVDWSDGRHHYYPDRFGGKHAVQYRFVLEDGRYKISDIVPFYVEPVGYIPDYFEEHDIDTGAVTPPAFKAWYQSVKDDLVTRVVGVTGEEHTVNGSMLEGWFDGLGEIKRIPPGEVPYYEIGDNTGIITFETEYGVLRYVRVNPEIAYISVNGSWYETAAVEFNAEDYTQS